MKNKTVKELVLSEILKTENKIASLEIDLRNLKEQYADEYSPIKKEDFVTVLYHDKKVRQPCCKVVGIEFDSHPPFWTYLVRPYSKEGKAKKNIKVFGVSIDHLKTIKK